MDLRLIPVLAWLLSWGGVIVSYVLSANAGHIPECFPHLSGCTTVSASGRYGAAYFVFKATILPAAALLAAYWVLCGEWLRAVGDSRVGWRRCMVGVGVVGAAALVVYATFLGSDGETYRALRRYGTVVFFGLTYLAEAMLAQRMQALMPRSIVSRITTALLVAMLLEGLVLGTLVNLAGAPVALRNIAEWHVASALLFYPALTWLSWRQTGFAVIFGVGKLGGRQ